MAIVSWRPVLNVPVFVLCLGGVQLFAGSALGQVDLNRVIEFGTEILRQVPDEPDTARPIEPRQQPSQSHGAAPASSGAQGGATNVPYTPVASRADVATVQRQLADLGYQPGPVDGLMGRRTRNAIIEFQRDRGLRPTGQVDDRLMLSLSDVWESRGGSFPAQHAEQPTSRSTQAAEAGPSFDCAKASRLDELAICANPDLAAQDRMLADAYRASLASATEQNRAKLRADQRSWLGARSYCGENVSCLEGMMEQRIAALVSHSPEVGLPALGQTGKLGGSRINDQATQSQNPQSNEISTDRSGAQQAKVPATTARHGKDQSLSTSVEAQSVPESSTPRATQSAKPLDLGLWMSAIGMPGSCGIACFDAYVVACSGTRDTSYRQETDHLAGAQLDGRSHKRAMKHYDDRYEIHLGGFQANRAEACSRLDSESFFKGQFAVRLAQQAGHSKFVNRTKIGAPAQRIAPTQPTEQNTQMRAGASASQAQPARNSENMATAAESAGSELSPAPTGSLPEILAPGGVSIGMTMEEAHAVLIGAGFKFITNCRYSRNRGSENTTITLQRAARPRSACSGLIALISVNQKKPQFKFSSVAAINQINAQIGAEQATCEIFEESVAAYCSWTRVPNAPLVKFVSVTHHKNSGKLTYGITAKDDLENLLGPRSSAPAVQHRAKIVTVPDKQPASSNTSPTEAVETSPNNSGGEGFEYGNVRLGMNRSEVIKILAAGGFEHADGSEGQRFQAASGEDWIVASYTNPPTDPLLREIIWVVKTDGVGAREARLRLTDLFGSSTSCSERRCVWKRQLDGWTETLGWSRRPNGFHIHLKQTAR